MLHDYLGAEVFMAGVQTYVEKKRRTENREQRTENREPKNQRDEQKKRDERTGYE